MNIEQLKNMLPDYAKDVRLNLATVFTEEGAPDLSKKQICSIGLGVAFSLKNSTLAEAILSDSIEFLSEVDIQVCKASSTIMAMNNIYYRFTHLVSDKSFSTMPAKLRMNVIGNPGIDKIDFELICLAISSINGCGMCIDSHTNQLIKSGVTKLAIQSAIRIASVLNAVLTAMEAAVIN